MYRQLTLAGRVKVSYVFVCNRTVSGKARTSLTELAEGRDSFTHPTEAPLLQGYLAFGSDRAAQAQFCRQFTFEDQVPGLSLDPPMISGA
jgi:hypothetical protein